jgi:hypothetical protein
VTLVRDGDVQVLPAKFVVNKGQLVILGLRYLCYQLVTNHEHSLHSQCNFILSMASIFATLK